MVVSWPSEPVILKGQLFATYTTSPDDLRQKERRSPTIQSHLYAQGDKNLTQGIAINDRMRALIDLDPFYWNFRRHEKQRFKK